MTKNDGLFLPQLFVWPESFSTKQLFQYPDPLPPSSDCATGIFVVSSGLDLEPANDACKKGIQDANAAKAQAQAQASNPFAKIFGPDVWMKIQLNPKLAPYLDQPDQASFCGSAHPLGGLQGVEKI